MNQQQQEENARFEKRLASFEEAFGHGLSQRARDEETGPYILFARRSFVLWVFSIWAYLNGKDTKRQLGPRDEASGFLNWLATAGT